MALIEVTEIWKTYLLGEVRVEALCGASLAIEKGEFVAVTGPSGSGKSTLMHILGCLDLPDRGDYRLDGERVTKMGSDERARLRNQKIGFVFQNFFLCPVPRHGRMWNCRCSIRILRQKSAGKSRCGCLSA